MHSVPIGMHFVKKVCILCSCCEKSCYIFRFRYKTGISIFFYFTVTTVNLKPFACLFCQKLFKSKSTLQIHKKNKHSDIYVPNPKFYTKKMAQKRKYEEIVCDLTKDEGQELSDVKRLILKCKQKQMSDYATKELIMMTKTAEDIRLVETNLIQMKSSDDVKLATMNESLEVYFMFYYLFN
jgi:hypothetical protein